MKNYSMHTNIFAVLAGAIEGENSKGNSHQKFYRKRPFLNRIAIRGVAAQTSIFL
jgi:hypothetical protein